METFVVLGLLALLVAAVAPAIYALHKRLGTRQGELEFWRVLNRRGLSVEDTARDPRSLGTALRRCVLCPNSDTCSEWLKSGSAKELEDFCPNARYVRDLERS